MEHNYWHPDDKTWMAARKELWRTIKYNLDLLSDRNWPIRRKDHKYHKELFFFGTINEGVGQKSSAPHEIERNGLEPFRYVLPIFRLWYHPVAESLDIEQLRTNFRFAGSLDEARKRFFEEFLMAGAMGFRHSWYPEYGMMGGREPLVVRFLCPGLDYRQELPGIRRPELTSKPCFTPRDTYGHCLTGTWFELKQDATFFPYAPGQYLWDHLAYAVEHYPEPIFNQEPNMSWSGTPRRDLLITIAEILGFEQRTDASRRRPSTIEMVERLIGKYERKEFPDAMLALWDEAKANIRRLNEESASFGMFNRGELRLRILFGVDYLPEKKRE